jgi:hypothetical protein
MRGLGTSCSAPIFPVFGAIGWRKDAAHAHTQSLCGRRQCDIVANFLSDLAALLQPHHAPAAAHKVFREGT